MWEGIRLSLSDLVACFPISHLFSVSSFFLFSLWLESLKATAQGLAMQTESWSPWTEQSLGFGEAKRWGPVSQGKERKPNAEKTLDNWQRVPLEATWVVITTCGQGIYRGSGKTPREANRETIAWSSRWAGNRLDSRDPRCEDVATREASSMAPRHPRLICGLFLPYGFLLLSLLFSSLS